MRRSAVALSLVLLAAYLVTRLVRLALLPMVSDEGTYITWGVRALHARSFDDWLASLEDGKQPLLAWLMPPLLALLPDRLLAGRLVSVGTGLLNLFLLVRLGTRLLSPAAGWIAAALYVAAPIALVHDRMALYDSLVTATSLLVLWAALAWAERPGASRTVLLGLAIGAALLTKLSALFFIALTPAVVWLWQPAALRRWWLLAQAYFLGAAIYSVLYISPIAGNIEQGTFQRYSLTAGELLRLPAGLWWKNVQFIYEAATTYLGAPLAALAAAGCLASLGSKSGRVLALWVAVPLAAFVLTAKLIYSRYVVFCFVAALLPAAWTLLALAGAPAPGMIVASSNGQGPRRPSRRWRRWLGYRRPAAVVAGLAALIPGLAFTMRLLADPVSAPWMNDQRFITDRFQYIESNYAGYGLLPIVEFLRRQAAQRPIVVLARDVTGMPRDGVTAYLLDWPNVQIGFVRENESIEARLERQPDRVYQLAAQGADLYYVLTDAPGGEQERRFQQLNPGLVPLMEFAKPGNHSRFQLYATRWVATADDTWLDPPASFGGQILLRGFRLASTTAKPGDRVRLVLYWEAQTRPPRAYTVFNHVATPDDTQIWGQHDGQPVGGQYPTNQWRPGETVADVHELQIRPDAPPGTYDLLTGLYELQTLQRLPVEREGQAATDRVVLGQITITG